MGFKVLVCALVVTVAVPVPDAPAPSQLASVDLSLTVFDQNSARSADTSKSYVIFAFDNEACSGAKATRCGEFEAALSTVVTNSQGAQFAKYKDHVSFGKANKDDFPEHQKDFEKAKVPLPAVLFWPAGHSRPSCKYESDHPSGDQLALWVLDKLKEEDDDDLLQLDEGSVLATDPSVLVCQADGGPNVVVNDLACADLVETGHETEQGLMQLEKTQKVWDFKEGETRFLGPADNSLPHTIDTPPASADVRVLDSAAFSDLSKQGVWQAIYFYAPWCQYCSCLEPVWKSVADNLVASDRQPHLVVGKVDGDATPELRNLFNVTAYPTFVVVDKDGAKVLGRYLGPRKVFELSAWIEDLIVAAENPILKHQFDKSEEGAVSDMGPVFPYSGPKAFGEQALASLETSVGLGGNEFDECLDSDEAKFTSPGVALLVHYASTTGHAMELDGQSVSSRVSPPKLTVVDFMVPWCPHCQKLNPVWDAISAQFGDNPNVVIGKVDLERNSAIKADLGIHRFPTIMYFLNGSPMKFDEAHRFNGQRSPENLKAWIQGVVEATGAKKETAPAVKAEVPAVAAVQTLASLEASLVDECTDADEARYAIAGASVLVQSPSRSLEMDIQSVSTHIVPQKLMVVDFMMPWCPHCLSLNPVWEELGAALADNPNVAIGKVDLERNADVKREFGVHRFPTIMYFKAGEAMKFDEARRYTGPRDVNSLKHWIEGLTGAH